MLIKIILNPQPRLRPSCNTLLNQEIIQTYINSNGLVNSQCNFEDQLNYLSHNPTEISQFQKGGSRQDLLNTIKLTPKLSQLNKRLPKSTYNEVTSKTPRNLHGNAGLSIVMGNSSFKGSDQLNSARVHSNQLPGVQTPKPTSLKHLSVDYEQKLAYPTPDLRHKNKFEQKNNLIIASSKHQTNLKRYSLLITRPEEKMRNQQRVLTEIIEETHEN